MTRLLAAMRTDVTVQIRNNLYTIGIGIGVFVAILLSQLISAEQLSTAIPTLLLLVVGGSTLLYVAGLIIFEKDEGTLSAVIVSPLRTTEYLGSKIITLTLLAMLEAAVMIGGALLIMRSGGAFALPNIPILVLATLAMGALYTLIGIVLIVRYDSITDFLVPVIVIALVLQVPLFYFMNLVANPLLLIIPTSAPTMIMRGAFVSLSAVEWLYALGYTTALLLALSVWAYRAFQTHIIMKVG